MECPWFASYINAVKRHYKSSHEFYHTIHHITNMFELYEKYKSEFDKEIEKEYEEYKQYSDYNKLIEKQKEILYWSIAYHDSYYMPGFTINEQISAKIADYELHKIIGYSKYADYSYEVKDTILSTDISNTNFDTAIKRILHDLDWSGFTDYYKFFENHVKIFTEAVCVGEYDLNVVKENQLKFYKSIIDKDIFKTEFCQDWNKLAKENLTKIISVLEK